MTSKDIDQLEIALRILRDWGHIQAARVIADIVITERTLLYAPKNALRWEEE